jgi:hypothetical protein
VYVARTLGEGPAKAMPSTVEVLFEMPGLVVVEAAGLAPGDLVIVEGNDRLYPTAPVLPSAAGGAGPTTGSDRADAGAEGAG